MNFAETAPSRMKREKTFRGWVAYDAQCHFCRGTIERFGGLLQRHGWECLPLQTRWMGEKLGLSADSPLTEVKMLTTEGKIFGGAEVIFQITKTIWWAWPLYLMRRLPGINFLARNIYERIATKRHCLAGACVVKNHRHHRHATFFEMP